MCEVCGAGGACICRGHATPENAGTRYGPGGSRSRCATGWPGCGTTWPGSSTRPRRSSGSWRRCWPPGGAGRATGATSPACSSRTPSRGCSDHTPPRRSARPRHLLRTRVAGVARPARRQSPPHHQPTGRPPWSHCRLTGYLEPAGTDSTSSRSRRARGESGARLDSTQGRLPDHPSWSAPASRVGGGPGGGGRARARPIGCFARPTAAEPVRPAASSAAPGCCSPTRTAPRPPRPFSGCPASNSSAGAGSTTYTSGRRLPGCPTTATPARAGRTSPRRPGRRAATTCHSSPRRGGRPPPSSFATRSPARPRSARPPGTGCGTRPSCRRTTTARGRAGPAGRRNGMRPR